MTEIKGLYRLSPEQRRAMLKGNFPDVFIESDTQLTETTADAMIENYFQNYSLPMGIAPNFQINGQLYHIPMVIEEPSVVAAASNGAKRVGNIITTSQPRELIGQIILKEVIDPEQATAVIEKNEYYLLDLAKSFSINMVKRGGGPTRIWTKTFESYFTVYLGFNPCDAMGANAINHVLEALSEEIEQLVNGVALMRILSNYQPESLVTAKVKIPILSLANNQADSQLLAQNIVAASEYAHLDVYRATTHNKGIMNGIDAVLMATGNDWRAVSAGVHAYASHTGDYQSLTDWKIEEDYLVGKIELPLAVATVGGTLSVHPQAKQSLALLGNPDAQQLSEIIAAVGLAQNFAALRALVSEGIQKGHMSLHARQLAIQAGANEAEAPRLIELLKRQEKAISISVATELLAKMRKYR